MIIMIITSTALIKSRVNNAKKLVDSLMSGELVPDKIYFFISEEPHNLDDGIKPHEVPIIDNPRVEFIYTENIGSLRKIVPIVKMYWSRKHTKIILFDDDWIIPPDCVKNLNDYSLSNPFHACGFAGNIYAKDKKEVEKTAIEKKYGRTIEFGWVNKKPKQVDILDSGLGLLIKPKFFHEDILEWEKYKEEFGVNYTDEHFVNYMLAKKGTPRIIVPIKKCPPELPITNKLSETSGEVFNIIGKFKQIQSRAWWEKMAEWRK